MISLVYKDFLLQRGGKSLIYMAIMPIISAFALSTTIFNVIMPYIAGSYLYIVYANALDDKYQTERLFIAMPVSRRTIVGSKYMSMGFYMVAFLTIIGILSPLFRLFIPSLLNMQLLSWQIIVQFFAVSSLYYSIYFPLYFKVGYQKSRWANYIALIASAGLFIGILQLVSELSGIEMESLQEALAFYLRVPAGLWDIIIPIASVGIIVLSIKLSTYYYKQREF